MKKIASLFTGLLVMHALLWVGCEPKPKEIPMEAFVKIFLKMAGDENFIKKYQKPEDAPGDELKKFTESFGYSGADFKFTMAQINKDEQKKKQFNDLSTQAMLEEAMKSLDDKALSDTTNVDVKKTK
jgi:hypothetical protein